MSQPTWIPTDEHPVPPAVGWTDLVGLYSTVNQLGATMNGLGNTLAAIQQAIATMSSTEQATVGNVNATTEAMAQITTQIKGMSDIIGKEPKTSSSTPKFREPKVFDGKATSVVSFLQEIRNAIKLSQRSLTTEEDKCLYFSTYLGSGTPKEWYHSIELSKKNLLQNFEELLKEFKSHFGDSNIVATAQRKLDNLYQTGSAAQYIARFNEWVIHLDLSEASKIHFLYRHLKDPVKDAIALVPKSTKPTKFKEYCEFVVEIDDRIHEREVEKKGGEGKKDSKDHYNTRTTNNTTTESTSQLPPGEPMEIDATKVSKPRGPLTKSERQHRRDKGLCLYCGGNSHKVKDCPNMSEAAKKAYADRQKAANGSGKA